VTIKVTVDYDKCQNNGLCCYEAPEVFHLDSDNQLQYVGSVDDDQRAAVEGAADACPMQAISFE